VLSDKTPAVYWGLKRDSGFEGFRGSQEKGLRDSGIKNKTVAKSRFKFQALAICAALMTFATTGWGQTYYTMSSGNKTWDFADIANWTGNFAAGTDAANWGSVAINTSGTVGDGVKISTSTAAFSTGTSGGVQKGTGNVYLLSSGTANSCAIDLYLNFSGRRAGTVSFDVATVFNTTGNRDSQLKLFYTLNGTTFTEITGTGLPYTARNNVAGSASVTVTLPSALDNNASVRLRFYENSTATGGTSPNGSQPKISIDNVAVTSTSSASAPTVTTPTVSSISTTSATLGANVTANGGSALTSRGTVWGTAATPTGNSLAEGGTATGVFTHSRTGLTANTAYYYRGYAINNVGTAYSVDGAFTTLPLPPTVGAGSSATTSGFTANWSVPTMGSAVYTYTVEVDNDSNFGSPDATVANIVSSITSQAITGLASGTTYYYRVKSVNNQGSSAYSSTSAGITTSAPSGTLSTSTGSLSALTATPYGTASASANFTVSGSGLDSSGVTVTPPAGFEVSTTSNFAAVGTSASPLSLGTSATISSTTVYVRLAATTVPGSYSGNISVAGGAATTQTVAIASSTVNTKALTITSPAVTAKSYDGTTAATITGSLSGVIPGDTVTLTLTGTFDNANVGSGKTVTSTSSLGGTHATRYTLTQPVLTGDITIASQTISGVVITMSKVVGDANYSLGASASSGLTLTYSTSDANVATVSTAGSVTIVGNGVATLTVSQSGNSNYSAATSVQQVLTVTANLAAWDISTATMTQLASPVPTVDSKVTVTGFTRGSGITTTGTTYPREWGGYMGSIVADATAAISGGTFMSFTVKANAGYKVSLSKIPATKIYSSSGGPKKLQWQYSTGGAFANAGSETSLAAGSAAYDVAEVDLSAVTALQNIDSSKTITLRLLGYSNSSATTGTFALYDGSASTAADISVQGTVSSNPTISTSGSLSALSTTYGTATATVGSFTVSGLSMTVGVTVTPPAGFEVSTTSDFSSTMGTSSSPLVIGASGTISSTSVYIRLPATASVSGSPYSGNVVLSSSGASSVNVATVSSTVSAKGLTITGLTAQDKNWDGTATVTVNGTAAYSGLANDESFTPSDFVTWAFADANVGNGKVLTRTGSYSRPSSNYTVTQPSLSASILLVAPSAPSIGSITAGDQQLSVAFTAPSSNGGATITNYEYSTDGGSQWTARNPANITSPLLISGLLNGNTYDVKIRALNNTANPGAVSDAVQGTPVAPLVATITASSTVSSALSTTYGTASSPANFFVSGTTLDNDLVVTAPAGFEVSESSSSGYDSIVRLTPSARRVTSKTLYVRLAKTTGVAGSPYSGNIVVSSTGADSKNVATVSSTVNAKGLTITGISIAEKVYDRTTTATITGTPSFVGLENGETFSVTGGSASFTSFNKANAIPVTVTGYTAPSPNYTVTQPTGMTANITAAALSVTGSTVTTKPYDGIATATITGATLNGVIAPDVVTLTGGTSGTFANANVGTGIAVSTTMGITGADAGNYSFTAPTGLTGQITKATAVITFGALPSGKKVGDVPFSAGALSTVGTLSYSSSNPNVAAVNATSGLITLVAPGVTTITANVVGTSNYDAATPVSQTLNVGGTAISTTVLTENMGTPSGTTTIVNNAFQNSPGSLTYSNGGQTNPADVRATSVSSGYTGATGGGNVFFTSTSGAYGFSIENINAAGTANLQLSYGYRKESASAHASLSVDYWNGTAWVTVANSAATLFTEAADATAGWYPAITLSLPSGAQIQGLKIRFVKSGSAAIRIDDVKLTASSITPAITTNGSLSEVTAIYGTASTASATTVTVTGGSLTADILATAPEGFEVSNGGATYGATATFAQTSTFANGTLYLRLAANAPAGSRSGNVVLSSTGATSVNVPVVASTVTAKALTVAAVPKTKVYGETDPALTYTSDGLVNGDALTGSLSRAVGTAVGTYAISQGTLANPNYNISFTGADFTITAASLASSAITLSPSGGSYTASGPEGSTFSYSYAGRSANGIATSYSSASAPTAAGYYTVTATATGNYSGSNTANYFVAGPVAVADSLTKPADNKPYTIPVSDLLGNDRRITSTGTVETTGLTATEVRAGAGSAARIVNFFVQFTPSSETTDTFTYTVSDGTESATATVTITTEAQAPSFDLQIVKVGTAIFGGSNTTITHDFIGVPNQTYLVEYSTDLNGAWTSAGNQSTGATGSFSLNITKSGDVAADWNAHMFFRARLVR
jgi:hypothetical protein